LTFDAFSTRKWDFSTTTVVDGEGGVVYITVKVAFLFYFLGKHFGLEFTCRNLSLAGASQRREKPRKFWAFVFRN
jgi:hypothetical protein